MLNLSKCQNVSHVGLSSLTNGAEHLKQLVLAYGPSVSLKPCMVITQVMNSMLTLFSDALNLVLGHH